MFFVYPRVESNFMYTGLTKYSFCGIIFSQIVFQKLLNLGHFTDLNLEVFDCYS